MQFSWKIGSNMAQKCSHRKLNTLSFANMELILCKTLISWKYVLKNRRIWPFLVEFNMVKVRWEVLSGIIWTKLTTKIHQSWDKFLWKKSDKFYWNFSLYTHLFWTTKHITDIIYLLSRRLIFCWSLTVRRRNFRPCPCGSHLGCSRSNQK